MTSRFSQRATGVAAATAIVLLVVLIVLLWTNVGQDIFHGTPKKQINVDSTPSRNNVISGGDFRSTFLRDQVHQVPPDIDHPTGEYLTFLFFLSGRLTLQVPETCTVMNITKDEI
ncbi:hypothetical protein RUM43_008174 [Polyplax serrata]|uniref:Uncharacterized protein n=1 Tax=Polyplax serrata TaxID=468196 RepID=A0AAN8P6Z2_POLSC